MYEIRSEAMRIAEGLDSHGSSDNLIANALKIESYLQGGYMQKSKSPEPSEPPEPYGKLDLDSTFTPYRDDEMRWSGTAQDLAYTFNAGNTLVTKARMIGMTTFLAHYIARQVYRGKDVLYFAPNRRIIEVVLDIIDNIKQPVEPEQQSSGSLTTSVLKGDFVSVIGRAQYDYLIVDGLGYLPYRDENDFVSKVMPLAKTRIFVSEPPRNAQGLFYNLWQESSEYQKVLLTWYQSLIRLRGPRSLVDDARRKELIADSYRREFECNFKPAD